jgi:probable F420-dependent oxidoreductase
MTFENVNFGAVLTGATTGREVAAAARRIQDAGFDGVWVTDRVDGADTLELLAAVTSACDLDIGTGVLLLPQRHPTHVARSAATLDNLSGGKLTLGVGVGGERQRDFEAYGMSAKERGRRADESLQVIKRLWTEEDVTFAGRYYSVEHTTLTVRPAQKPHPPLLIGGRLGGEGPRRDAALRRTARYGDGWLPYLVSPDQVRTGIERLAGYCEAEGRDANAMRHAILQYIAVYEDRDEARRIAATSLTRAYGGDFTQNADRFLVFGPPHDCAARIAEYVRAGLSTIVFNWACNRDDVTANIERIGSEVIPAVRDLLEDAKSS